MASERTETGDKEDRWRQGEEGDVCHRQTAGTETDKEGACYDIRVDLRGQSATKDKTTTTRKFLGEGLSITVFNF